jgi:hypothetical protein
VRDIRCFHRRSGLVSIDWLNKAPAPLVFAAMREPAIAGFGNFKTCGSRIIAANSIQICSS